MKPVFTFGRIMLGLAYIVYGYLHFAYTTADAALVPQGVGRPAVWVILIGICWWAVALSFYRYSDSFEWSVGICIAVFHIIFVILPDFNGVSSWLSMASVFALIGGSLQVAVHGKMWYRRKNI